MAEESKLMDKLLSEAIAENRQPISPQEFRRQIKANEDAEIAKRKRHKAILLDKHKKDLEKRNAPLKANKRKEGK